MAAALVVVAAEHFSAIGQSLVASSTILQNGTDTRRLGSQQVFVVAASNQSTLGYLSGFEAHHLAS